MPYHHDCDPEADYARVTSFDIVTPDDIIAAFEALSRYAEARRAADPGRDVHLLWDLRVERAADLAPAELARIQEAYDRYNEAIGPGRVAWLVKTFNSDAYMIAALLRTRSHSARIRKGFTDEAAALAWLREGA